MRKLIYELMAFPECIKLIFYYTFNKYFKKLFNKKKVIDRV